MLLGSDGFTFLLSFCWEKDRKVIVMMRVRCLYPTLQRQSKSLINETV